MSARKITTKVLSRLAWKIAKYGLFFFFSSTILVTLIYKFMPEYVTPLMLIRCYQQHEAGDTMRLKKTWVPIEKISPNLPRAVVASEDNNFMHHHGFDFDAIMAAAHKNFEGEKVQGGSTISQQTAKNVFLWPSRNWIRKGLESYFTVLIEIFWSKERIMEVYLNVIEMGDGIYGAEAASQAYYYHPAVDLTRTQAALIAAALPAPLHRNPGYPNNYMWHRCAQIKRVMRKMGPLNLNQ